MWRARLLCSARPRSRRAPCSFACCCRNCDSCLRVRSHAAVAQGTSLHIHTYNVLLHLCSGGNQPEEAKRVYPEYSTEARCTFPLLRETNPARAAVVRPPPPADVRHAVTARVQVFEHMNEKGVVPIEMTYTALARIAGAGGNGARALELVRAVCHSRYLPHAVRDAYAATVQIAEMRGRGLQPKLRTFTSALQCFCEAGDIANVRCAARKTEAARVPDARNPSATPRRRSQAIAVEADIRKSGVAMSELEYTLLLTAMTGCVSGAGSRARIRC